MTKTKFILHRSLLPVILLLELVSGFYQPKEIYARVRASDLAQTPQDSTIIRFEPPPDRGRPRDDTASGGSRGQCPQDTSQPPHLTLLLPLNREGLTLAEHPTFFAYVPQTRATMGEFVLYDETQKAIAYQTTFPLSGVPGIVKVQLPTDRPALEIGKSYQWRFLIRCKLSDRSVDAFKIGWIKRVSPNRAISRLQNNIAPTERARIYAQNGIWYDTLKIITELRPTVSRNTNSNRMWRQFLQSELVKLEAIVSYPLVDCCQPGARRN